MRPDLFSLLLLLLFSPPPEIIPSVHVQTFADTPLDLPADLRGKVGILLIGFSKKSSLQTKTWNDSLLPDYAHNPHVAYFEAAVLVDVPTLLRAIVIRSIRGPMPLSERAHFFAILQDAAKWKAAANVTTADDAYLLITGAQGQIVWRFHGAISPPAYSQLKERVADVQKSIAAETDKAK